MEYDKYLMQQTRRRFIVRWNSFGRQVPVRTSNTQNEEQNSWESHSDNYYNPKYDLDYIYSLMVAYNDKGMNDYKSLQMLME